MKELPFPKQPKFLCYHNKAFPVGILEANISNDITGWLCAKSINCVFNSKSPKNKFDICMGDPWGVYGGFANQQSIYLRKDLLNEFGIDLISFLRTAIDNDCYINGAYNEKYIPNKWAFQYEDYMHDYLLTGYDADSFISVGFVFNGRFEKYRISNKCLLESLLNNNSYRVGFELFSVNHDVEPIPNMQNMICDLNNYICSGFLNNLPKDDIVYGISALKRLAVFFDEQNKTENPRIDIRYSRALMEHEWVLQQIVTLFYEGGSNKIIKELSDRNFQLAQLIHMLGLKLEYSGNKQIINRVVKIMNDVVCNEVNYVPQLIFELQRQFPT